MRHGSAAEKMWYKVAAEMERQKEKRSMYAYRKKEEDIRKKKKGNAVQRKSREAQKSGAENNATGIPAQLKERMESHTGLSLDDVRVHYHSDMPKRLDALAYTQGNQVYLGPGQERHLPHELGHVVQQKLGNVRADTRHESGALMNTDAALEREADEIGALRKPVGKSEKNGVKTVQRRIEPQSEQMDDGALLSAVRGRMGKKYKKEFEKEIKKFYRLMKSSSYPFTNDDILLRISEENWHKEGTAEELAEKMELEKQEELDVKYGGERGHMVSRHIEIPEKDLRARVEGEHAIERASKFDPGVKGRDQALYVLEKLQPILQELLRGVLSSTGGVLVEEMQQIATMRIGDVKTYLRQGYGIDFDRETKESEGEFDISYILRLQKSGAGVNSVFTLSIDYSVLVNRIFRKQVVEKAAPGKRKRVYEPAQLFRGKNKPCFEVTPATGMDKIEGLVEASGIDYIGVTLF